MLSTRASQSLSGWPGSTNSAASRAYVPASLWPAVRSAVVEMVSRIRVGDVRESMADITQARELLGYETQVHFEEGLRRTIDWYREQTEKKS